jgi:hypothetical protein
MINCIEENCHAGSAAPPLCPSPGVGIPLLVKYDYQTFGFGDNDVFVKTKLIRDGSEILQREVPISEAQFVVVGDWFWNDGDVFQIQLYDTAVIPQPLTPVADFELRVRNDGHELIRSLDFRFDVSESDYTVEARNW